MNKSIVARYKNTCAVQQSSNIWVYRFENRDDVKKFLSGYCLTASESDSSPSPKLLIRCSLYKEYRTKLGLRFWLRKVYYKFL